MSSPFICASHATVAGLHLKRCAAGCFLGSLTDGCFARRMAFAHPFQAADISFHASHYGRPLSPGALSIHLYTNILAYFKKLQVIFKIIFV